MKENRVKIAVVIVCLILGAVICAIGTITADSKREIEFEKYVVEPGDTLWDIATETGVRDTGGMVWEIREKNGIEHCVIKPGDVILVPVY